MQSAKQMWKLENPETLTAFGQTTQNDIRQTNQTKPQD
jgi:hypothetical protein